MPTATNQPASDGLIGLDWGTSSLRAYQLAATGTVREARHRDWGLRYLPEGGFDAALSGITAGWPALPLLACGMVGSRRGWCEAAYVEVPADTVQLAGALVSVRTADDRRMHIVPGMHNRRGPDVMRGEETQLAGALALHPELAARSTWILPGTHSKWVSVREHAVTDFASVMTGELFTVLREHTILGDPDDGEPANDPEAFALGVARARDSGASGAMGQLFSVRSLTLDGELARASVGEYLSGLLIGEEFRGMLASERFDRSRPIQLIGAEVLCQRYLHAARQFGLSVAEPITDAAAHGLWHIARHAGLLDAPASHTHSEASSC